MKKKFIIVIPARYNSSRLPGKPLIKILGVPMLLRTFNQCKKVVPIDKIFVATDDNRILNLCKNNKINCILTSKKCLTGTDRVYEISKKIKVDFYINVQGDEPICNVADIKKLIRTAKKFPHKIINGYTKINDKKSFFSTNIPKVIFRKDGRLLYQSRAPIPYNKKGKFIDAYRQVCLYSYPYKALKEFSKSKKKSQFEKIEDIELLRFLELGHDIYMIKMSDKSISVDTKENLLEVALKIKSMKKSLI